MSVPMLNLHWDVLPAATIEKTIWGRNKGKVGEGGADACHGAGNMGSECLPEMVGDEEVEELKQLFCKKPNGLMSPRATPRGGAGRGAAGGATLGDGVGGTGGGGQATGNGARGAFFGDAFPAATPRGKKKKVLLLDVGRGNNVAIGLKSFKLAGGVTELADVIGTMDPKGE